jgi:hypothetical protein
MWENFIRRNLFFPDEIMIRKRYLRKEVDAPNLFIIKNFIRFLAVVNCGKIVMELPCGGALVDHMTYVARAYIIRTFPLRNL